MTPRKITIGSRGSDLALWQAHHIKQQLEILGAEVQIAIIKTKGDHIQHLSFDKIEGKGFFTKELEEALLAGQIDLAVHSYKDLETTQPDGLAIAAVSERANPADVLLIHPSAADTQSLWGLRKGAITGTSSARRKMQLTLHRPDLQIEDIRGNVPTRIDKLRQGHYQAIVLAMAGIERLQLELSDLVLHPFDPYQYVPAPAQGVLACQIRSNDDGLAAFMAPIHHPDVAACVHAERRVLNLFKGGCQLPLGAYCTRHGNELHLRAIVAEDGYSAPTQVALSGTDPERLALQAVDALKKKSASHTSS